MIKVRLITCVALAACVGPPAFGQYRYSTIVDSATARPDGAGNFFPCCYPAMENQYVAFTDNPGTAIESIWSKNLITGALQKLVDLNTHVPGGTGNFLGFETCQGEGKMIRLHNGTVLFYGADVNAPHCSGGLYSVPVTGGTIKKVVDYHQTMPDGGAYGELRGLRSFDLSGGKVAFAVNTSVGGGVFSSTISGGAPATVADTLTPYCYDPPTCGAPVTNYDQPVLAGSTVVYWGNGVFDPSTGYNDLLTTPIGGSAITEIANSKQPLPGDTDANFHTRFHYPFTDGGTVYFVADDSNYSGPCLTYTGIFSIASGAFTNVINSCAALKGITQIDGQNSFMSASANQGTVVYDIADATGPSIQAMYSSARGVTNRVIGGGDALLGGTVNGHTLQWPGPQATFGGRVAFETWTSLVYGLFLASPPCSALDTALVSIKLGNLTFNPTTKVYSQTATVTNTSASNITGPLSLLVTHLTAGTTLANENGVTLCQLPTGSPYINLNLGAANVLLKGKSTTVTLQFKNPNTGNITFTPKVAGPGSR
jgi:hypothetical protein